MTRAKSALFAAAVFLLAAAVLLSQSTFGVIRGRVLDPTGAAVPGVTVLVTNTGTGIGKSITSDAAGAYEVGYLQPGTYSVSAEAAGFKKFLTQGLVLSANATVVVDVKLEVGDLTSSVTVEAGAPVITTESAAISDIKTQQQYLLAPLNNRGWWDSYVLNFVYMVPGVQPSFTGYAASFAGTRFSMNNFSVDGITTVSTLSAGPLGPNNPSMESIREVKVDFSGHSAEFGAPGYVNIVTKGGENQLHGSLFWLYNTAGLNARNYFARSVAFEVMNNFGGSISGPVKKNKTFFSGSFEGFNRRAAANINTNLPSARIRQGDFSQLRDARGNLVVIKDPATGQPFPGNVIPSSRLNPTALKIQSRFFPMPNYGDPESVVGNYRDLFKQAFRKEQVDVRIDHTFSEMNSMFARFNAARLPNGSLEGGLPTIGARKQRRQARNFLLSDTHTFRPNLINEFRFGVVRGYNPFSGPVNGPQIVKELGLTNLPADLPEVEALPTVSIAGFHGVSQIIYWRPVEMIYQWQDNVSWIRGRHTIKIGGEVWRNFGSNYGVSPSSAFGSVSFTGNYSGNGYADFLLGIPRLASRASAGFVKLKSTNYDKFVFIQDDFKATPRLTINLGLRYEINPPYVEKQDLIASFDPYRGILTVPTEASKSGLYPGFVNSKLVPVLTAKEAGLPTRTLGYTDWNNFAPRIGVAYKLTSDSKTVLRSGYGIYYDAFTATIWRSMVGGPYNGNELSPVNTITNGQPLWQLPDMFPRVLSQVGTASLVGLDPHIKNPYIQQWNFTLEREVAEIGLRASYIGSKTHQLALVYNKNQLQPSTIPYSASRRPFPQLAGATWRENGGNAYFNSLVLSAERKFKNGLQFQLGHTWAKNLTDTHSDGEEGAGIENSYDRRREWGNHGYTRRHRFVFSAIYDLPFGAGHRLGAGKLANYVAGGWTLSVFGLMQTGPYFTPSFSGSDPANIGTSGGRPDRVGSGKLENPTIQRWFDPAAFVAPPANAGRFGNSGVNILRGPGTQVLNAGLFKKINLGEKAKLQMEATFTNVLNHTNFSTPYANISISSAGVIGATQGLENAGPRTTRLGMRIDF